MGWSNASYSWLEEQVRTLAWRKVKCPSDHTCFCYSFVKEKNIPTIRQLFPNVEIASLDASHWVHSERYVLDGRCSRL